MDYSRCLVPQGAGARQEFRKDFRTGMLQGLTPSRHGKTKTFQEEKVGVVSMGVYKGRGDFFFNKNSSVWTELI